MSNLEESALRRLALTDLNRAKSIGVRRTPGMRLGQNPYSDPPWLQVVGILDHP
jgi:hypothetical protein